MIKRLSLLIALFWVSVGFSQINNISPYSYFGVGENNPQVTVASSSMGDINSALSYSSELNFTNPAALNQLDLTTFSISGRLKYLKVDDGTDSQSASYTSLASLALGIPINEKGGFLVGLQPNSNVGYAISEEIYDTDNELIELNNFDGNGGTNRFFGGFGYLVTKGLSLGLEAEYIFGNIENTIVNIRQGVYLQTKYKQTSNIKGSSIKIGSQYSKELKNELEVKVGAVVKLNNTLKATSDEYLYSLIVGSTSEIPKDTLMSNTEVTGNIKRPLTLTAGTSIGKKDNWAIGVEFETQDALEFDESVFQNNSRIQYAARSRYSLGGFWIPNKNSISSYWNRVVFRAGIKYENTGLSVSGNEITTEFTPINDFGMSFGMGLPIGNQLSQVNFGLEYGKRGSITDGIIKENYFNLRLDLNLADKWFRKRKIN